jgi:hypothetical protein
MGWNVLWTHSKVGSWIANTNHKQFFDHYVSNKITTLFEDYNYMHEKDHVMVA